MIVDALLAGKDVESQSAVQEFLARFLYTKNKSGILQGEIESAVLSHDEIVSFPEIYPPFFAQIVQSAMQLARNTYERRLFAIIDGNEVMNLLEVEKLSFVFFKHVALYRQGWILVWRDLFAEWVQKSRKFEAIGRLEQKLRFPWLRRIPRTASDTSTNLSFQQYVYAETIKVLESHIGFSLDGDFRIKILEQMKDENFRSQLVFFLGHFTYLLQVLPGKEGPAFQWLIAIRRFIFFQYCFSFPEHLKNLLFRFIFYTETLPEAFAALDGKFEDLPKIEQKQRIEALNSEAVPCSDSFWKKMRFFAKVCTDSDRAVACTLKVNCLTELAKARYAAVTPKQMEEFLLSSSDCNTFNTLLMIQALKRFQIKGHSDRVLPVLSTPLVGTRKKCV